MTSHESLLARLQAFYQEHASIIATARELCRETDRLSEDAEEADPVVQEGLKIRTRWFKSARHLGSIAYAMEELESEIEQAEQILRTE